MEPTSTSLCCSFAPAERNPARALGAAVVRKSPRWLLLRPLVRCRALERPPSGAPGPGGWRRIGPKDQDGRTRGRFNTAALKRSELCSRRLIGLFAKTRQSFKPIHRPRLPPVSFADRCFPMPISRPPALRSLRWRERAINSAAPLPVDPFEELIHVACEAQEHVVLFEPERTPPTFVSGYDQNRTIESRR